MLYKYLSQEVSITSQARGKFGNNTLQNSNFNSEILKTSSIMQNSTENEYKMIPDFISGNARDRGGKKKSKMANNFMRHVIRATYL